MSQFRLQVLPPAYESISHYYPRKIQFINSQDGKRQSVITNSESETTSVELMTRFQYFCISFGADVTANLRVTKLQKRKTKTTSLWKYIQAKENMGKFLRKQYVLKTV